jgi:DNA replication initiation complex subunit (GINS family)
MNEISYDLLWQMVQKEKQTNELQLLPKTFYADSINLLKSMDKKDMTEEENNIKKNTAKLLLEIYERRKQKLLIYVAYKKHLPQPAIQIEQDLYDKLADIVGKEKINLNTRGSGQSLVSLQKIPEIILPSGKKAGPFEKDQVIETPADEEDTKFLISNSICREI